MPVSDILFLSSKFTLVAFSLQRVLGLLNILPLPVGTILSFVSKGYKRNILEGWEFSFRYSCAGVLALQAPAVPTPTFPLPHSSCTHSFPSPRLLQCPQLSQHAVPVVHGNQQHPAASPSIPCLTGFVVECLC